MTANRRLIVMRHAKSSWSSGASTDHSRPLNERGRRDAPRIAARLVELNWQPEWILSSDAERTQETSELMADAWKQQVVTRFVRNLYHAGYDEVVAESVQVPDDVQTLLVLGHNPGWEDVVHAACGESVVMKTATAALLSGRGENWESALRDRGRWQLMEVLQPSEL